MLVRVVTSREMSSCYPGGGSACNEKPVYGYRHTGEAIQGPFPFSFEAVEDSRILVVSNSPETLVPTTIPQTLYRMDFANLPGSARFRVWMWHLNDDTSNAADVALRLTAPFGTVSNYRRFAYVERTSDILSKGMCLAERQLYQTLTSIPGNVTLPAATEVALWSAAIPSKLGSDLSLLASVHEFDVAANVGALWVRTACASTAGSWGLASDLPVPPDNHVRGWWPHTRIRCVMPGQFDFSLTGGDPPRQTGICEANGGDNAKFAHQGVGTDPHGTDNKGCYGADLVYRLPCQCLNSNGQLYVALRARNNAHYPGGPGWAKYAGAARIIQPNEGHGNNPFDVPKYPCELTGESRAYRNSFDLLQSLGVPYIARPVLSTFDLRIEVANAGAAALPTNILLSHTQLLAVPVDPPQ